MPFVMMNAGRGRCGAQRRKESLPPGQIQEDFTEEVALKSVLKGLGGVRQVGVGERAFQAKDSRAKASETGRGLENGRGSGKGVVQRGRRVGWGCSGRRDGEGPGHQGPQVARLRGLD